MLGGRAPAGSPGRRVAERLDHTMSGFSPLGAETPTFSPRSDASSRSGVRSPASAYAAAAGGPPQERSGERSSPAAAYAAARSERRKPRAVSEITAGLKSHAAEIMENAKADGLFDALKAPEDLRQKPPAVAELHALFDTEVIVGVWRRTHYAMGAFPLCLTGKLSEKVVATESFECVGSAWRFVAARDAERRESCVVARLECVEVGRAPMALEADLTLTAARGGGADWIVVPAEPFRGDPADLPVTIEAPDGRRLCSDPNTKTCVLVPPEHLDDKDSVGAFRYNVAWECSLMSAQRDDDPSLAFLDQYLAGDLDEAPSEGLDDLSSLEAKLAESFPRAFSG